MGMGRLLLAAKAGKDSLTCNIADETGNEARLLCILPTHRHGAARCELDRRQR